MALVISLDYELMWGVRDKESIGSYGRNILGVREAIPAMLKLFTQYKVKATWAAVGMLLAKNKGELLSSAPDQRPRYTNRALSPFDNGYIASIGRDEKSDPYHYGYSLAAEILQTPGMELATHTYSHYYCLEDGQDESQFRSDLQAAVAASKKLGATPRSIVFPRNQFNPAYLSVCSEVGLRTYRGNERAWIYRASRGNEPRMKRLARLADNYANFSGSNAFRPEVDPASGMLNAPSSRFLRPFSKKLAPLEPLRMARIKSAMTAAAKSGDHFHLWWHPHNFGANTPENLRNLDTILRHYAKLRDSHAFDSLTMEELTQQ